MELLRIVFRRLGKAAVCSCGGHEAPRLLRLVQQHLAAGASQDAWHFAEQLRGEEAEEEKRWRSLPLQLEALATHGVAAAATGRYEVAREDFQAGRAAASAAGDQRHGELLGSLLARVEALSALSRGERDPMAGPYWRPAPPPPVQGPAEWASWLAALPLGAEFVGPVEIRWLSTPDSGLRGLFATRDVEAGEALLVARPLACGADLETFREAARSSFRLSARARRCLAALASPGGRSPMPPERAMKALSPSADALPSDVGEEAGKEVDLGDEDVLAAADNNVLRIGGRCELYGLPSILNNACDCRGANAVRLRLDHLDGMLAFVAARRIEAGEELRHCYEDLDGPRQASSASGCRRRAFDEQQLPGTPAMEALESARLLFANELREEMRQLQASLDPRAPPAEAPRRKLQEVLDRLLKALQSVEDAFEKRWGDEERAWCLARVQPLLNASIWCFLRQASLIDKVGDGGVDPDVSMVLRLRTLSQLVATWQHTRHLGSDHLRSLQMLWSTADEARVRAVAELAAVDSTGLPDSSAASMRGADFFAAAREQGLRALLQRSGGLVRVSNVLPEAQADEALALLQSIDAGEWALSANIRREDADHRFWRYEGQKVDWLRAVFSGLVPGMHPHLNAAKYDKGGRITLHNDARSWEVEVASPGYPQGAEVHRKIALILYLTKGWQEAYGGVLVDNMRDGPEKVVPAFNSMVCFLVPREHWVTQVMPGAPMRYSLFGWFSDFEQYPAGCVQPLGSGNLRPGSNAAEEAAEAAADPSPASGGGADAEAGVQLPPAGAALSAREAVALAAATKRRCEEAFEARFGIPPDELRLGKASSPVSKLLERLKGSE